ncbi:MAG: HEAT repeat domain-containing protein [Candidatus Desulfacyla sp.]
MTSFKPDVTPHRRFLCRLGPLRLCTFYPAAAVLAGLAAAQIIATLQVYLSNRSLYHTLAVIKDAGYLIVPNPQIMGRLHEPAPAVYGGLFFTLSIGAGISLLSLAAAWTWDRVFSRRTIFLVPLLLLWSGFMVAVNWNGISPLTTAYFAAIPPLVFRLTLRWMPQQTQDGPRSSAPVHLMTIALLASLWMPQMSGDLFLVLRDRLLLSNTLGIRISDFYYRYTLYPAEVFKSLDQKLLKTCSLDSVGKKPLKKLLTEKLLSHDYLLVEGKGDVDLKIRESGRDLNLETRGRGILQTAANDFLLAPSDVLKRFSSKTDRHRFFRQFTYYGLLIGFPVTLYLFLYSILFFPLTRCGDLRVASLTAAFICFLAGVSLLIPLWLGNGENIEKDDLPQLLESGHWKERVAALKFVRQNWLDVAGLPSYRRILSSPHIPERYWLAKALSVSRSPETYEDLLRLLDDPSPSVACMAFQSLGRRGDRDAAAEILKRIQTSDHWYVQWYAYRALKELGWKQADSR